MSSKYDNNIKSIVLDSKMPQLVAQLKRDFYKKDRQLTIEEDGLISQIFCPSWEKWKKDNSNDVSIDCAIRLNESKYRKAKRIREKITDLVINNEAVFITLTFTDEVLAQTSPTTRRKYVARYLKEESPVYVANVDFSPEKQREHYHAVIMNKADFTKWKYGFVYAETIRNKNNSIERTSKYVAKLTSHALKTNVTTRLIYSRDTI